MWMFEHLRLQDMKEFIKKKYFFPNTTNRITELMYYITLVAKKLTTSQMNKSNIQPFWLIVLCSMSYQRLPQRKTADTVGRFDYATWKHTRSSGQRRSEVLRCDWTTTSRPEYSRFSHPDIGSNHILIWQKLIMIILFNTLSKSTTI